MNSFSGLFRISGYAFLLLSLFDAISTFIPPQFTDRSWQFQTAGIFVEHSIAPILGFILVFYDNLNGRKEKELPLLRVLSWLSLLTGIFYLVLIFALFITPFALDVVTQERIDMQFKPKIAKLQQIQTQATKASTAEVEAIMKSSKAVKTTDPQAFRSEVLQNMATAEKKLKQQSELTKDAQRLSLLKSAIKWGLGALVSAVVFIRIWAATDWARDH